MTINQNKSSEIIFLFLNLSILIGLTLFGTAFSKFNVFGALYLHDLLVVLIALSSLVLNPKKISFLPIIVILLVSLAYLFYSFQQYDVVATIIIRQFALFGYLGCYYLLNRNNQIDRFSYVKRFIFLFGILSCLLQSVTIAGHLVKGDLNLSNFNNHYWYSHASVLGIIISAPLSLIYLKNRFFKILSVVGIFALTWTTGHASAQLSVLAIIVFYFVIKISGWKKIVPICLGAITVFALMEMAPQFNDNNSSWRLLTWEYHLNDLIRNKYGILGNGFGAPYTSTELEMYLFETISSTALQERGRPDERFISPPHNSFITIFFSIGIIPGLLVFGPFIYAWKYFSHNFEEGWKLQYLFLLSLIGLTIWCSFNVVLELPHSAGVYWLVYFTFWQLQSNDSSPIASRHIKS